MQSDKDFIKSLVESMDFVSVVAAWLQGIKCDVMIRPTIIRPDFETRNDYADSGDIEIRQRVEVKKRKIAFTSVHDYPYETVIVDEKYKIDRIEKTQLWGYLIGNGDGTHVCCIKPETKESWVVERKYDKQHDDERDFYLCPKELCSFHRLHKEEER